MPAAIVFRLWKRTHLINCHVLLVMNPIIDYLFVFVGADFVAPRSEEPDLIS